MKDNISIIFAAIIGSLLIIILPLFSILDRQDSMSYNVVLTQTTKFVDNIRNRGFIDRDSYYDYISALASTSNTYKVEMEIYRKRLIPDVDAGPDTYIEDIELFNTMDVLEVIEDVNSISNAENSNEKNNVYLLKENDEVYIKVYNTNITAGSIIYNAFSSTSTDKVINISYGGVVNNINWELFEQINATAIDIPEVLMEVPVNASNQTNIMKVTDDGELEEIDCNEFYELCEDGFTDSKADQYTYLYDLTYTEDTKMTIAVELKNVDSIVVGENADGSLKFANLQTLTEAQFNAAKNYIKNNFIQLNEMTANIDLQYRGQQENGYYAFNIVLNDVKIASYGLMSVFASVSILPGLGQDVDGTISMGVESVKVELVDQADTHSVTISDPINWRKLQETGRVTNSMITNKEVYVNQEIAFIISYTGISEELTATDVKSAVIDNLEIYNGTYINLEILTAAELKSKYNISLNTRTVGHILVKFQYKYENTTMDNYVSIRSGWIQTNANDDEYIYEGYVPELTLAYGAESSKYSVWRDSVAPHLPQIVLDGIQGMNGWYTSNVNISVVRATVDRVAKNGYIQNGGVGVDKNTLNVINTTYLVADEEITEYVLEKQGTTTIYAIACDYLENCTDENDTRVIAKIDKTLPGVPKVTISGTKAANGWYKSNVTLRVSNIYDNVSGVQKVTYAVNDGDEKTLSGTTIISYYEMAVIEDGISYVTFRIYDNAGNYSEETVEVKIDRTTPAGVDIDVVSGNINENGWYNTDVALKISAKAETSPSKTQKIEYELSGPITISTTQLTGQEKELTLTQDGTYTLTVRAYNNAGAVTTQVKTIRLDKTSPVGFSIYHDRLQNSDGWINATVNVNYSNTSDAVSGIQNKYFVLTKDGVVGTPTTITGDTYSRYLGENGIYVFDLYSVDNASNQTHIQDIVKIDTINPIGANFVINGTKGVNGWYTSDVNISYTGGSDNISGVKNITLSKTKLTSDSNDNSGTLVTLTTTDYAGNSTVENRHIKVDKTLPTKSIITVPAVTGTGVTGVNLYNKEAIITINPGTDKFLEKSTYKITGDKDVAETQISSAINYTFSENGRYELISYTYDLAGNVSTASTVIWINKDKPQSPNVSVINDETIVSSSTQTVTGKSGNLEVQFTNVQVGNKLKVKLVEAKTYETKQVEVQVTEENPTVTIQLQAKGKYSITATQTNMFGTESNVSSGVYYYQYQ